MRKMKTWMKVLLILAVATLMCACDPDDADEHDCVWGGHVYTM